MLGITLPGWPEQQHRELMLMNCPTCLQPVVLSCIPTTDTSSWRQHHVVVATAYVDFTSAVGSSRARKTQFTRIRPTTAESNHCRDTTCFAHPRHVEISNCFDAFPNPLGAVASPPDWCFAFISIPRGGGCGLSIAAAGALTRLCAAVAPSRHAHTHLQPATHRAAERNTHENVAMSVE